MEFARVVAVAAAVLALNAAAQPRVPTESPFSLFAVPEDGVGYYAKHMRARELWREGKHAEAEPLLEALVREYPRDAWNWRTLARVKARLGKHLEAAEANKRAGALEGWDVENPIGYRLAINYAAAGDRQRALETLRWMIHEERGIHRSALYEWDDLKVLRGDREFLDLIGRFDTKQWSRDEGWRRDVDFLYEEAKRVNPEYRDKPFPPEVVRRYVQLKRDVPRLSDQEVFTGMYAMLAPLRQGHVAIWPMPGTRFLPLRFYAFPDGIYVIDGRDGHGDLAGARVVSIGKLSAEEAWRRLNALRSYDGEMELAWGVFFLADASILKGIGAAESTGKVEFTLQMRDGSTRSVSVATKEGMPSERIDKLVAPATARAPLFLSRMDRVFWHAPMPEHDAFYVQLNNVMDEGNETLEQYGRRLWGELSKSPAKNLVVDLRHNNGGNTLTYPEFLRSVIAFSRVPGHRVYVLIGRRTYSAAGNLVTDLERLADPVFVGEASSECCRMHGDPTTAELPYSKVKAELTAVIWNLSSPGDRRREMSPHLPVQLTAKAYFAGQDPALDAVTRAIAHDRGKK